MADEETVIKQELVKSDEDERTVYHYVNSERNIDVETKEVSKREDKVTLYQLKVKWGTTEIIPRYNNIKVIILENLRGMLPPGFSKLASKGYSVTPSLRPLIRFIDKNSDVESVIVSRSRQTSLVRNKLTINISDWNFIRRNLSILKISMNEEVNVFIQNFLADKFPTTFIKTREIYRKGAITNFLRRFKQVDNQLDKRDKETLFELFEKLSFSKDDIFERVSLIRTREKIEKRFIEDILAEFERLLNLKRVKEERWQTFFNENAAIFSQLFAHPTVIYKSKAYVGGKSIGNVNGKIVDFLYRNKLTKNSALIEIKLHTTKLMKTKPYRGSDVFQMSSELNGAVSQILDQKQTYMTKFDSISDKDDNISALDPKCLLIIGLISTLKKKQLSSFELLRRGLKDVEIITFDELYERIKSILSIFHSDDNGTKK